MLQSGRNQQVTFNTLRVLVTLEQINYHYQVCLKVDSQYDISPAFCSVSIFVLLSNFVSFCCPIHNSVPHTVSRFLIARF